MKRIPIESVTAYTLMLAPVYVLLKRNEKFVSVKSPLDFFTPDELDKLKSYGEFYLPPFMDVVTPFLEVAGRIRTLFNGAQGLRPAEEGGNGNSKFTSVIEPAPYEFSDAVLRIMGPIWSFGGVIEPFFVCMFINEVCPPMTPEVLDRGRNQGVEKFEYAILMANWVAFLAMHLGYLDFGYLVRLRNAVFLQEIFGERYDLSLGAEIFDLHREAREALPSLETQILTTDFFWSRDARVSQKLANKLARVKQQMIKPLKKGEETPSIFGVKGFAGE